MGLGSGLVVGFSVGTGSIGSLVVGTGSGLVVGLDWVVGALEVGHSELVSGMLAHVPSK